MTLGRSRPEYRFWPTVKALREERFDLAVLLPNSIRTGIVAWMGGARRRIGYDLGGRRWFLTDRLLPQKDEGGQRVPSPAVDYYLAIVRKLGCAVESNRAELFTTVEDEQTADRVWEKLGLTTGILGGVPEHGRRVWTGQGVAGEVVCDGGEKAC